MLTQVLLALAFQDPMALQRASIETMRASLDTQAAAARRQAPAFFAPRETPPEFPCEALPQIRAAKLIGDASRRTGVSAGLLQAVIQQESAFRPCAVSEKGARGLMQLMPATMEDFGVTDPFDPEQNVNAGAALLGQLLARYSGDLNRVLGAYNAGPARVDAAGGVPMFPETLHYVNRVLETLKPIEFSADPSRGRK